MQYSNWNLLNPNDSARALDKPESNYGFLPIFVRGGFPGALLFIWLLPPLLFPTMRNESAYQYLDMTGLMQMGVILCGGVYSAVVLLQKAEVRRILFRTPVVWFGAYMLWCVFGSLFCDNVIYSLACSLEVIAVLIISAMLFLRFGDDWLGMIYYLCRWGVVMVLVFLIRTPDRNWFAWEQWHNASVFLIAPMFFLPFFDFKRLWKYFLFMLLIALVTTAAKVYLGLLCGLLIGGLFCSKKLKRVFVWYLMCVFLLVAGILVFDVSTDMLTNLLLGGREDNVLATGNGRFMIWPILLEYAWHRPILGYGFAMAEKTLVNVLPLYISSSHNIFLTAFLYSGLPGVALLLSFWVSLFWIVIKYINGHIFSVLLLATVVEVVVFVSLDQGIGNKLMFSSMPQIMVMVFICYYLSESFAWPADRSKNKENAQ